MKTIIAKFALIIVITATVTSTSFAQRWGYANCYANNEAAIFQPTCINQITGLTDEQIEKITVLEEKHQAKIDEYRTKRRSTFDIAEKNELRDEMDKIVEAHRKEVNALLTEDQQEQYAILHTYANPNYARGRRFYGGPRGNRGFVGRGGRGNCYANVGRGGGRGFASRNANFRGAGYGRCRGMNANIGRGYGRGFYNVSPDTSTDTEEK